MFVRHKIAEQDFGVIQMHQKTWTIGLLSLTATVMATALLVAPSSTEARTAGVVARERDYTLMTAQTSGGGDAVYVMDNRRGVMAVLTYDNASRGLRLRGAAPVSRAFPGTTAVPAVPGR